MFFSVLCTVHCYRVYSEKDYYKTHFVMLTWNTVTIQTKHWLARLLTEDEWSCVLIMCSISYQAVLIRRPREATGVFRHPRGRLLRCWGLDWARFTGQMSCADEQDLPPRRDVLLLDQRPLYCTSSKPDDDSPPAAWGASNVRHMAHDEHLTTTDKLVPCSCRKGQVK